MKTFNKNHTLTHWGLVTQISISKLTVAWLAPSHYLNQCCNTVNLTLRNKFQRIIDQNSNLFIQENAFEYVIWKMTAILSLPWCVQGTKPSDVYFNKIYPIYLSVNFDKGEKMKLAFQILVFPRNDDVKKTVLNKVPGTIYQKILLSKCKSHENFCMFWFETYDVTVVYFSVLYISLYCADNSGEIWRCFTKQQTISLTILHVHFKFTWNLGFSVTTFLSIRSL